MNHRLVEANIKLVDENKTLKNDVEILERRIEKAKQYCVMNGLEKIIKILDGEEIG